MQNLRQKVVDEIEGETTRPRSPPEKRHLCLSSLQTRISENSRKEEPRREMLKETVHRIIRSSTYLLLVMLS